MSSAPARGSWVEFTVDIHDVIYVHIDKKKKFPATALLRAFGHGTNADILKLFFATKELNITGKLEGRQERREVIGALLAMREAVLKRGVRTDEAAPGSGLAFRTYERTVYGARDREGKRYSVLVRRYHPDRNGGDRSHEKALQAVIDAYTQLKSRPAFA